MHGCISGPAFLVNAEVDSMGGVVDGGGGIGTKSSPESVIIENTQAVLRQNFDVREEIRRQLDFLEKGCDPLEFTLGNAASVSVQSTSPTDQHPELIVTSEAKGSFAPTASPPGDSVESSGRPGAPPVCDPNTADNLMLFDGENDFLKGERKSIHLTRSSIAPSEQSSQMDGSQNAKESGDSAAFGLPKKAYKRRNRSRPNRDGTRSSSMDVIPARGVHASLPSRHVPRDAKGLAGDADSQKDRDFSSNSNSKPMSANFNVTPKSGLSDSRLVSELDGAQALESTVSLKKGAPPDAKTSANTSNILLGSQHHNISESGARETPCDMASEKPESFEGGKQIASGHECAPFLNTEKVENQVSSSQMNGFSGANGDRNSIPNEFQNNSAVLSAKGLDSESSCTQTNLSLDGNNDSEICTNLRNGGSNGNTKEETVACEETPNMEDDKSVKENNEAKGAGVHVVTNDDSRFVYKSPFENGSILKNEETLKENLSGLQNEVEDTIAIVGMEPDVSTASEKEMKPSNLLGSIFTHEKENACSGRLQGSINSSIREHSEATLSARVSTVSPEQQTCPRIDLKLATKAHEDSVLEEARIIEAKRNRIAELSVRILPRENVQKSHWDFVLEEMAWLANDFAQERLWKITAAAQIGHQAASASRLKSQNNFSHFKQKEVAHTLAKAVMEFWHLVETSKEQEIQYRGKNSEFSVQGYALRFLKYNNSCIQHTQAEPPVTPDRLSDLGIMDMSWDDHLTEENLFYAVPSGAMEAYRKSIESHLLQFEKIGSAMLEEAETSGYDTVAEITFEEDEGETNEYYLPGAFEGSKSSKFAQTKRKNLIKAYAARSYETGSDFPFMQCRENKVGTHQSGLIGKRPASSLNASIPTKRVRTASRPRVLSPFNAGTSGSVQAPNKTDASSGDTNSFQDDQSTLQGGSQIPNNLEVESVGDFEKQLPFDSMDVSHKPKKKKAKNLASTYEHKWQMDSNFQNEQREYSKRRLESHQLESNGSSGLFGQHIMKKPKMMKQSLDNSVDNITPMAGSISSPVASQMSNMSNSNKFIKMLGGRDRGRKTKALKTLTGQPGSESPWSLFEDQALVVLVHDMGPNWELVSDAINSTLQFKCIFRKPKECKERHKCLMDTPAGDGVDSAEDSGSSQTYRSTLPGIPKGSARQLFQRLQGPIEEETIKSHLEKIILIGKKQHHRRTQNDNQEPKQLQQPHSSHTVALSQVCPNNLNGGPVLTPLDLCDATASSPDVLSLGYQSPHTGGLPISNQGTGAPIHPASSVNSSLQPSANAVLGSNFSSPSAPVNASARDGRYGIPRTASLSIDEHQRMQQYNQMLAGRNIQQSSLPVPGVFSGTDRGVRMLTGGNGAGIVGGLNRSMPMARPGLQGIVSSSVMNSGSMISSGMLAIPDTVNLHSGAAPSQGNSMLRPRDALHMMRPTQNQENQRQMMVPDLQIQASQGTSQGGSPFGALTSPFSNQTAPAPVQSYPLHHQHQQPHPISGPQSHVLGNSHHPHLQGPNHATNTQHQAYAIRLAKERHIQQQRLIQQQQQQQFSGSNASMPHVPVQSQLPISSPQNGSQLQSHISSPPVSLSPLVASSSMTPTSQHPQKHLMPPHGVGRNHQAGSGGLTNQMGKQRQRQPQQQQFQQPGRQHPQQRQQSHSQQQTKILKGVGRGNMMMHQNLPMDQALLNGLSTNPGSQPAEKGEQVMLMIQGQGLYSGSGLNSGQPPKQSVSSHPSNQSQPQQKIYPGQATPSSKQLQQIPSVSDNSNQNHAPPVVSAPILSTSLQTVQSPVISSSNHHHHQQSQTQPQPRIKFVNQSRPTVQRELQQNFQVNSESPSKLQGGEAQADQHPVNNSPQMGRTDSVPEDCIDATSVIPVVSSASAQWKASEQLYDSSLQTNSMQLGTGGCPPPLSNSPSEPLPSISHGLGHRQSSGSLPPVGHDVGLQWSQQPSQRQPPTPPPPVQQQQQQESSLQQLPPQQQAQQQTQLLQGGSSGLYVRPPNSRLE